MTSPLVACAKSSVSAMACTSTKSASCHRTRTQRLDRWRVDLHLQLPPWRQAHVALGASEDVDDVESRRRPLSLLMTSSLSASNVSTAQKFWSRQAPPFMGWHPQLLLPGQWPRFCVRLHCVVAHGVRSAAHCEAAPLRWVPTQTSCVISAGGVACTAFFFFLQTSDTDSSIPSLKKKEINQKQLETTCTAQNREQAWTKEQH